MQATSGTVVDSLDFVGRDVAGDQIHLPDVTADVHRGIDVVDHLGSPCGSEQRGGCEIAPGTCLRMVVVVLPNRELLPQLGCMQAETTHPAVEAGATL